MKSSFIIFFLFSIFLFSRISISQTTVIHKTDSSEIYRLTDVVISATKSRTSTLELANSISIIDSTEISNRNTLNLIDLMKNEYGLSSTSQGGPGTLSNVYLRGGGASYTHVLVDGIEMNLTSDPSGVYDFALFSHENIERIEILRGPQSILYGSDAMAGVINIVTKKPASSTRFSLSAEGGTYNTYKTSAGLTGTFEKFQYSFSSGRIKSDGFSAANEKYGNTEKDGYIIDNISTKLGYKFSEDIKTNFSFWVINSKADYDQSGINGDDPTYKFMQEEFALKSNTELNFFNKLLNHRIGASFVRNIRKYEFNKTTNNPLASTSLYDGRKFKIDLQNSLNIKNNIISLGIDFEIDEVVSEYNSYSEYGDYSSLFPKNDSKTLGTYLQNQFNFDRDLFTSIGVRFDFHDKFGTSFTYRIAPAYLIWQTGTKIKATLGTGFKTPSLFYLYDPAFGNPDLKPEKSFGWDAGIEQFFWKEGITFGITYFNNNYRDLFGFDSNFRTINVNKAETAGIEVFSTIKPFWGFNTKLNYTYTVAEDRSEGVAEADRKLIRRPEHKIGGYISYDFSQTTNMNIEIIYVGEREDLDFGIYPATRIQLEPYLLMNIAAHYRLFDFLRFNLRVENLLNTDYEEVFGYGTAGLSFYGGFSIIID